MRTQTQIRAELLALDREARVLREFVRRQCLKATTAEIENWGRIVAALWQQFEDVVKEAKRKE